MMYQAITSSVVDRVQVELFSAAMDGISALCRQAVTGACLGAVGLTVIMGVTAMLIGAFELGIGAAGPLVSPDQILHY